MALAGGGEADVHPPQEVQVASLAEEADLSRSSAGETFEDDSHSSHDNLNDQAGHERMGGEHELESEHEGAEGEHGGEGDHGGGTESGGGDSGGDR